MGSQDDFYQTDEEVDHALASLYVTLRGNYYNWYFLKNALSDDVWTGGGSRGDNAELEKLNEFTYGTDASMIEGLYSGLYSIIYKANLIIDKVTTNTEEKARTVAEARVWRAYAYFELTTLWGTSPLVDHLLEPSEYRLPNSTAEEKWAYIESDLKDAIGSGKLPSKSGVDDNTTGIRITQESAEAILGKVYLFEGKYAEAADMLNKVIASGKYALYTGDYSMLLHAQNNNGPESMIELQMRNDTEQAWNQFSMRFIMTGWRTDKMNIGGQAAQEIAMGTYGFFNPRASLYDAFVKAEGKDGYRLNATIRTYDQMQAYGVTLQSGVSLYGSEGYFNWKTRNLKSDCVMDAPYFQALQYVDLYIMRYAEVILLAAEANLQSGNTAKALEQVNMIRSRAKEQPLASVTLDDIKLEKRLELCWESVRYQDLVRWGDAPAVLGQQGAQIPSFSTKGVEWNFQNDTYGFQDRNMLLPLPLKAVELNTNLTQNTGW